MVMLQVEQIQVLPGQRRIFQNLSWQDFEAILEELGEKRASQVAYFAGTLEIHMPLPEHERAKVLIAHLLVALLDCLNWEWESLGSTTFKNVEMLAGIEPDDCFYIQNFHAVIGLKRFDYRQDPPPDLVIEIDLTSKTQLSAYEALKVPEIWRYENGKLVISVFQNNTYFDVEKSRLVPQLPIIELFSECLTLSETEPMSVIRRLFLQKVKSLLN